MKAGSNGITYMEKVSTSQEGEVPGGLGIFIFYCVSSFDGTRDSEVTIDC